MVKEKGKIMGYYIVSKKINLILNEEQQKQILKAWQNPPENIGDKFKEKMLMYFAENFENCSTLEDALNELCFEYEKTKRGIKVKSYNAKLRNQDLLFERMANIVTPGSFMTFRGEDGALFGFFFNNEMIEYSSYDELKELVKTVKGKDVLEKALLTKKSKSRITM